MSDLNLKIIKDYIDKKVAGALTGKSAYEIAVEQGYEGTEEEWLSEMKDYEDLENKPQIKIDVRDSDGTELGLTNVPIDGVFGLLYGFKLYYESSGNKYIQLKDVRTDSLNDNKDFLVGRRVFYGKYNFNSISSDFLMAGIWEWSANKCVNAPPFINEYFVQGSSYYDFFIIHIYANSHIAGSAPITRLIIGRDIQGKLRILCQQIIADIDGTVSNSTDWQEISSGGSQIVSGVVNQNGTITFTDSDGGTVTTTENNIVTSSNQQISIGYDSGGFYFLFDDGQEV